VGLERGPLSLVSTIEEQLGRNSSGSGLENREYGRRNPLRWPCDTLYQQKLALTSPTSDGHSVGIVRLLTMATKFVLYIFTVMYVPDNMRHTHILSFFTKFSRNARWGISPTSEYL
jgi:hypothetical protein